MILVRKASTIPPKKSQGGVVDEVKGKKTELQVTERNGVISGEKIANHQSNARFVCLQSTPYG
jgi:hypothetical protein